MGNLFTPLPVRAEIVIHPQDPFPRHTVPKILLNREHKIVSRARTGSHHDSGFGEFRASTGRMGRHENVGLNRPAGRRGDFVPLFSPNPVDGMDF
jgi:hypothetical protein